MLVVQLLNLVLMAHSLSYQPLIMDFAYREHVNTMILFHCDSLELSDLFKQLSAVFSGMILSLDVTSSEFYELHHHYMTTRHYRLALMADLECPGISELLDFCSVNRYYNASYRWLMFARNSLDLTLDLMKMQNVNIDSHITIAVLNSNLEDETYAMYEVFGTIHRRGGGLSFALVGNWSRDDGGIWNCTTHTHRLRSNLKGLTLRASITSEGISKSNTLQEYLVTLDPPKNIAANRYGNRVITLLRDHLNFKVKYIITDNWRFDVIGSNSPQGIMGQLQKDLVDLSATPIGLATERTGSFDQTIEIVTRRIMTFFRHPKNGGTRNIFLQPFQNWVWCAIANILIVSTIVLVLAFYVRHRCEFTMNCQFALNVLGLFCQQSSAESTTIISSRIVITIVILFSIIIYQFYSCFIIGYLLVLPPKNIRTLEQLLNSRLQLSIEDVTYNRDYFNRSKRPIIHQILERKILPNEFGFANISTGIALAKRGGHAYHCDTSYGYTWIMETFSAYEICEIQEVELYPMRPSHIVLPKGSPLKEPFRVSMRLMMDTGLLQYYRKRFYVKKPLCSMDSFSTVQVGFWDIADLYWLLSFGIAVSLLVLVVEVVRFRVRKMFELRGQREHYLGWVE